MSAEQLHARLRDILERATKTARESSLFEGYEKYKQPDPVKAEALKQLTEQAATEFFSPIINDITVQRMGHSKFPTTPVSAAEYNAASRYWPTITIKNAVDSTAFKFEFMLNEIVKQPADNYTISTEWFTRGNLIEVFQSEVTCCICGQPQVMRLDMDTLVWGPTKQYYPPEGSGLGKMGPPLVCEYQDFDTYQYSFNIPSGKLVIANVMYHAFGGDRQKELDKECDKYIEAHGNRHVSINNDLGLMLNSKFWAEKGLLHVQVGNTCPSVYRSLDKKQLTIRGRTDDEDDEYTPAEIKAQVGENVAWVCTDLWAVTAMDYDFFKQCLVESNQEEEQVLKDLDCTIVDVVPGEYLVTDFYCSKSFNPTGINGYARLNLKEK